MEGQNHTAKITGSQPRNLNPLIISDGSHRELEFGWWWLHLGNKPAKFTAFNSRAEALTSRWSAGLKRRGLAPATWYVEKGEPFGLGGDIFALAAITTTAVQPDGTALPTYSIVTREAVGVPANTHPRMPLLIAPEMQDQWLHPGVDGDAELIRGVLAASEDLSRHIELATPPEPSAATLL